MAGAAVLSVLPPHVLVVFSDKAVGLRELQWSGESRQAGSKKRLMVI